MNYAYSELAGIFAAELGDHWDAEKCLLKHYLLVKDNILDDAATQLILSLIENINMKKSKKFQVT